jgi:hypothetical protein
VFRHQRSSSSSSAFVNSAEFVVKILFGSLYVDHGTREERCSGASVAAEGTRATRTRSHGPAMVAGLRDETRAWHANIVGAADPRAGPSATALPPPPPHLVEQEAPPTLVLRPVAREMPPVGASHLGQREEGPCRVLGGHNHPPPRIAPGVDMPHLVSAALPSPPFMEPYLGRGLGCRPLSWYHHGICHGMAKVEWFRPLAYGGL